MHKLRVAFGAIAAGLLVGIAGLAVAQQYPTGQIRLVVPVVPGGAIDNGARFLGEKLRQALGQTIVIDNRPGANYVIGTAFVAKAPADGHTLLFTANGHVVLPLIASKVPYDSLKDFVPVATLAYTPYVMLVNPALPVNTVQEFIAYAKARPGQLNFASGAVGAGSHMAGEVFNDMTGTNIVHIPYKGGGPALNELMAGRVHVTFNTVNASVSLVKSGKVKALAITSDGRWPELPEVPTFAEAGLPTFQERAWLGVMAPAGTPKAIVDRLNAEIAKIQRAPGAKEEFEKQGLVPLVQTPEQFAAALRKEIATIGPIVKAQNIRLE